MTRSPSRRALLALVVAVTLLVSVVPRGLPELEAAGDPARPVAALTVFGLRLLATVLAGYITLVLTALALMAARLLPSVLGRAVQRWTARGLAAGIRRLVGASAVVLGVLPLQPSAAHADPPPPVLAPAELPPPGPTPRLEPLPPPRTGTTVPPAAEPAQPPRPPVPVEPDPTAGGSVTVASGDSFWSIAQQLVRNRLGRTPADIEVLEPWVALIDVNRDRLVDPADPDLLHPGQVLRLPDL